MIIEVKVPQLSESVAEATLLDWHKKEGERVSRDENLIDIETDKVVLELPAPVLRAAAAASWRLHLQPTPGTDLAFNSRISGVLPASAASGSSP